METVEFRDMQRNTWKKGVLGSPRFGFLGDLTFSSR